MEREKETYKIRTNQGRIITLTISAATTTHYVGIDKFGKETIVPLKDIDSMYPVGDSHDQT